MNSAPLHIKSVTTYRTCKYILAPGSRLELEVGLGRRWGGVKYFRDPRYLIEIVSVVSAQVGIY